MITEVVLRTAPRRHTKNICFGGRSVFCLLATNEWAGCKYCGDYRRQNLQTAKRGSSTQLSCPYTLSISKNNLDPFCNCALSSADHAEDGITSAPAVYLKEYACRCRTSWPSRPAFVIMRNPFVDTPAVTHLGNCASVINDLSVDALAAKSSYV